MSIPSELNIDTKLGIDAPNKSILEHFVTAIRRSVTPSLVKSNICSVQGESVQIARRIGKKLARQIRLLSSSYDRGYSIRKLGKLLKQSKTQKQQRSLLLISIDQLERLNATLGHRSRNQAISILSRRLGAVLLEHTLISRTAENEYVAVVWARNQNDIEYRIKNIFDAINDPMVLGGREICLRASIGRTEIAPNSSNVEKVYHQAQIALHHARSLGGNTSSSYHIGMGTDARKAFRMEADMHRSLERSELELHYQPQIDIDSGKILGMEALVRWNHPERGLIPPSEFIPLAERTGLMLPIGEWVLRKACQQTSIWHESGFPGLRIAVNLSPRQFDDKKLPVIVKKILDETNLDPKYLELEVTENSAMHDVKQCIEMLHQLKSTGVEIAIDDFGTGHSSLSYLKQFPIDRIKIDQEFVRNMTTEQTDATITEAVISLAHNLGCQVIAEGVETLDHVNRLMEYGCKTFQGYFFSRPVSAYRAARLLRDNLNNPWQMRRPLPDALSD